MVLDRINLVETNGFGEKKTTNKKLGKSNDKENEKSCETSAEVSCFMFRVFDASRNQRM